MADEVRETIRAAQAAELRGDIAGAIALLQQAATLYRRAGNRSRALQMLRQALRLDASRSDVAEEMRRLEWLPDNALAPKGAREPPPREDASSIRLVEDVASVRLLEDAESLRLVRDAELLSEQTLEALSLAATDETLDATALERALESAAELLPDPTADAPGTPAAGDEEPVPGRGRRIVERGPSLADPALDAWCSFCCRPRAEVGELVAGPAGAFICAGCSGESSGMLGGAPSAAPVAAPSSPATLVGQEAAQALLERALSAPAARVLLLGPEGSGKSTWVRSQVHAGRAVLGAADSPVAPRAGALLVFEDVDRLTPEVHAALASWLAANPACRVLLTARGEAPAPLLTLREGSLQLPVYGPEALAAATAGALPASLLQAVGPVVCLARPDAALLEAVARAWRLANPQVQLPEAALPVLARAAAASAGAGHSLAALLARVVPGQWELETGSAAKPAPARRGRRKG